MAEPIETVSPLCPSSQANISGSVVFGVVGGTVETPKVAYLQEPQPVTDELLALAKPVEPTEVYRIAASCLENGCQHFNGHQCRLAQRIVEGLPTVVKGLPPCRIRQDCRWWQQEGKAACLRCPQIVRINYSLSEQVKKVIEPERDC
ncbi:MAG: nitrogen fixation protein [Symploca sp. SIO2C1]|nr:nitrogen fixation protein [Symploca sp. SIO2C1]